MCFKITAARTEKKNAVYLFAEFVVCFSKKNQGESLVSLIHPSVNICSLWRQNRCWSVRHTEQRSSAPRASPENLLIVLGGFTFPQMGQLIKTAAPWLTIFQPSDLPDHRVMTFTKS